MENLKSNIGVLLNIVKILTIINIYKFLADSKQACIQRHADTGEGHHPRPGAHLPEPRPRRHGQCLHAAGDHPHPLLEQREHCSRQHTEQCSIRGQGSHLH